MDNTFTHGIFGVTSVRNIEGNTSSNTFDAMGRLTRSTDFMGNQQRFVYDNAGRLLRQYTPFEHTGSTTHYAISEFIYDRNGNITRSSVATNLPGAALIQPSGHIEWSHTNNTFQHNRLMSSQTGNSPLTEYTYNRAGNILTMRVGGESNAAVTTFTYNNRGQLTQTTDALGQTETMTYDANGNLLTRTDRNGTLFRMTYDNMGRLVREEAVQNGMVTAHSAFTFTATGAVRTQTNAEHQITNTYDAQGRLIRQTEDNDIVRTFTYNEANNVTDSRVYIGNNRYMHNTYTFDAAQRVRTVTSNGQLMSTYTFNANGARTSTVLGNGTRTDYTRNLAGLVTRLENRHGDTLLFRFDNIYYLDGNMQQVIETMAGETRTITYTYDSARRLIREQDAGFRTLDRQYTFDNRGNRTHMTVAGDEAYEVAYTYDLNNRLLTETRTGDNPSTNTFTYDSNGNQLSRATSSMPGTETHTYNAFNQLVQFSRLGTTVTYTYRADGLRRNKTISGTTTTHVWMGSQIVLERRGDDGTVINRFHRSASGRMIRSEHHGWYLHNVRGDVVQRISDSGNVLRDYRYSAFGVELDQHEGNTNSFRWNGEYWDWATSTYYLRARHFSPRTGRFSQPDPFWNVGNMQSSTAAIMQSSNLYLFTMHNPIRWADPTGLFAIPRLPQLIPPFLPPPLPPMDFLTDLVRIVGQGGNTGAPVGGGFTPNDGKNVGSAISDFRQANFDRAHQSRVNMASRMAVDLGLAPGTSAYTAFVSRHVQIFEMSFYAAMGVSSSVGVKQTAARALTGAAATRAATTQAARSNPWGSTNNLMNSATASSGRGVTAVGRAFQKHSSRPGTSFPGQASGNAGHNTQQGMNHLTEILNNPNSTFVVSNHNVHGSVLSVRMPCGKGALWSADGNTFITFLEAYTRR